MMPVLFARFVFALCFIMPRDTFDTLHCRRFAAVLMLFLRCLRVLRYTRHALPLLL